MRKIGILLAIFLISIIGLSLTGCTENSRAKSFGGNMIIELNAGDKLLEATWKNDDLWVLTRERRADEPVESYKFSEDSSFGVWEGVITINEN